MSSRTIAIGDIHGCSAALSAILAAIDPQPEDTLVFLGDYVDRGPDSRGVLETLMALGQRCQVVALMGNHEEMMLGAREGESDRRFWKQFGGQETLDSYGPTGEIGQIPWEHFRFLKHLPLCYETDTHFFAHANYAPNLALDKQSAQTLLWMSLDEPPAPHYTQKMVIVGHTPQKNGRVLDKGHLKCIDTGCGHGGLLTALDVDSGGLWQVRESGGEVRYLPTRKPVRAGQRR